MRGEGQVCRLKTYPAALPAPCPRGTIRALLILNTCNDLDMLVVRYHTCATSTYQSCGTAVVMILQEYQGTEEVLCYAVRVHEQQHVYTRSLKGGTLPPETGGAVEGFSRTGRRALPPGFRRRTTGKWAFPYSGACLGAQGTRIPEHCRAVYLLLQHE